MSGCFCSSLLCFSRVQELQRNGYVLWACGEEISRNYEDPHIFCKQSPGIREGINKVVFRVLVPSPQGTGMCKRERTVKEQCAILQLWQCYIIKECPAIDKCQRRCSTRSIPCILYIYQLNQRNTPTCFRSIWPSLGCWVSTCLPRGTHTSTQGTQTF